MHANAKSLVQRTSGQSSRSRAKNIYQDLIQDLTRQLRSHDRAAAARGNNELCVLADQRYLKDASTASQGDGPEVRPARETAKDNDEPRAPAPQLRLAEITPASLPSPAVGKVMKTHRARRLPLIEPILASRHSWDTSLY